MMTYSEFIYWFDGFTTGKGKLNPEEMARTKSMLDNVLNRKPSLPDLPSPPFNPDFPPIGSGL